VPKDQTNIWIFRSLCAQLGITIRSKRVHEGNNMTNYCWLYLEAWIELQAIVIRREQRRNGVISKDVIAPLNIETNQKGAISKNSNHTFNENQEISNSLIPIKYLNLLGYPNGKSLPKIKPIYLIELLKNSWRYLSMNVKTTIRLWIFIQWLYFDG
jgi:hypothetical protein